MILRLDKHYSKIGVSDLKGRAVVEREFYLFAYRSIWHLYTLRNWVSHDSRQVTRDDYVECMRAFEIVVRWYNSICADTQTLWFIPVEVEGIYVLDTETNRSIQIPKSVLRLKRFFEEAYSGGDYEKLGSLIDEKFTSPDIEWFQNKHDMLESIQSFHRDLGGTEGLDIVLDFLSFELDNDGSLWWVVKFAIRKPSVIDNIDIFSGRLTGLREETARLLELRMAS